MRFGFSTEFFDPGTVIRLAGHLATLLDAAAVAPAPRYPALPMLTDPERRQIEREWNATAVPFPHDAVIHDLIADQAARTPDAPAAVFGGETLDYAALDAHREPARPPPHRSRCDARCPSSGSTSSGHSTRSSASSGS